MVIAIFVPCQQVGRERMIAWARCVAFEATGQPQWLALVARVLHLHMRCVWSRGWYLLSSVALPVPPNLRLLHPPEGMLVFKSR